MSLFRVQNFREKTFEKLLVVTVAVPGCATHTTRGCLVYSNNRKGGARDPEIIAAFVILSAVRSRENSLSEFILTFCSLSNLSADGCALSTLEFAANVSFNSNLARRCCSTAQDETHLLLFKQERQEEERSFLIHAGRSFLDC